MTGISITEFKARASEIVHKVRHEQASYIITYRDQPIAQLTPLIESQPAGMSAQDNWAQLTRLGVEIAAGWPAHLTSADILSDIRR